MNVKNDICSQIKCTDFGYQRKNRVKCFFTDSLENGFYMVAKISAQVYEQALKVFEIVRAKYG